MYKPFAGRVSETEGDTPLQEQQQFCFSWRAGTYGSLLCYFVTASLSIFPRCDFTATSWPMLACKAWRLWNRIRSKPFRRFAQPVCPNHPSSRQWVSFNFVQITPRTTKRGIHYRLSVTTSEKAEKEPQDKESQGRSESCCFRSTRTPIQRVWV